MSTDVELLRRYAAENSETAFAELVRRHVNLVYAAALRQTRGDVHLAQDVGQQVFSQLARKATALSTHPALVAWLCRTTRFYAIDALRARQRREARERKGEFMSENFSADKATDITWEKLQPLLDGALDTLAETDRAAVALRFFEEKSFREIGDELGLQENAARMRVDRALEKLRRALGRRGCTSTATALAAVLAGEAAAAASAPGGWAAGLAPAALAAAGAAGGVGTGISIFAMNKLTVALLTGIAAAGLTTAGFSWKTRWTHSENARLRAEIQSLRQLKATRAASEQGAGPTLGAVADADKLTRLAERITEHNTASVRQAVAEGSPKRMLQNRGLAAPTEAIETFAWACYTGDVVALAKQIHFDGNGRQLAFAKLAQMPPYLRDRYKTPEELYAFFTAADALVYPPPSDPELLKKAQVVFVKPDRVQLKRPNGTMSPQQYQWTAEGWKMAYPEQAIEDLADEVLHTNPLPAPEAGGAP